MSEKKTFVYDKAPLTDNDLTIPEHVRATLTIMSGGQEGEVFPLTCSQSTIGRGSGATVVIDDDSMSRKHCEVGYRKLEFRVRDLESSNGTFLNGSEVEEYALRDGDKLVVGETLMVFRLALD